MASLYDKLSNGNLSIDARLRELFVTSSEQNRDGKSINAQGYIEALQRIVDSSRPEAGVVQKAISELRDGVSRGDPSYTQITHTGFTLLYTTHFPHLFRKT